jgi:ketosteroid isomerase-like protein
LLTWGVDVLADALSPERRQTRRAPSASVASMKGITQAEERAKAERSHDQSDQRIVSMTPDGKTGSSIEVGLRRRIDALAQAIRDKNVERLMSFYAPDVVAFDVGPPLNTRGAAAYRKNFEHWFGSFEGPLGFELHNLRVVPGEGAAFCHYLGLITGARSADHKTGYWVRGTTCFERRDGEWLVTHEHISMPA